MERDAVEAQLAQFLPAVLVYELLTAHEEAKRAYYLGGLRLAEVEGGRFCEAAFRILEHVTTGIFTPIGKVINTDQLIRQLGNTSPSKFNESVRIHVPRCLRVVYDIRNKRDAAHLGDGIDPNLQDATLVVCVLDWILAELLRLYHDVDANTASEMVEDIVARKAPLIQEFDGFLKVLDPTLLASDYCLVLLYQRGKRGAPFDDLYAWVRPTMRDNLGRTMARLVDDKAFVHESGGRYRITRSGELEVETRTLLKRT